MNKIERWFTEDENEYGGHDDFLKFERITDGHL